MEYLNVMFNSIILSIILGLSLFIIIPIVWICSAISVYKDAKYRNENVVFLTLLDIFSGGITVPIFYMFNIVKPYNEKNGNIPKKMPVGLLVKFITMIVIYAIFGILFSIMFPFGIGVILVFVSAIFIGFTLLFCIVNSGAIFALYNDAKARDADTSLWCILALFFSFITYVVYIFVVIKSKEEKQVLSQYPVDNNQNRNELEQLSFEDLQMNNNGQSSNFEEKKPISNKIPPMIIVQIVLNIFSYVTTILMFMR